MSLAASIWLADNLRNPELALHVEIARFELPDYSRDAAALEDVFRALNGYANKAELVAISDRWYEDENRSLSVGDIVVLIRDLAPGEPALRNAYRCANIGWESCDDPDEAATEAARRHDAQAARRNTDLRI